MELTNKQSSIKKAIIAHLLTVKENSYKNMMTMQQADMNEAEKTNEESENMFEDGKVDQSINRVEARASVVEALQRDINLLANLEEIEPTKEIQLGDVIHTNHGNFFVGVVADEFEIEGKKYRGISTDSPLYKALQGKHDGDEVELNGNTFKLEKSY